MNNVQIIGRLTSDVELKQTQSGIVSCRFTIAVNRRFVDKNSGERQADFITCVAWRQQAEFICKYWSKGKMIAVDGSLRTGSYQDKNHSDVTHYTTDVNVNQAYFCGDKSAERVSPSYPPNEQQAEQPPVSSLDDFEEILSEGDVPF